MVKETKMGISFFEPVKSFWEVIEHHATMMNFNRASGRDGWRTSANLYYNRICLVGSSLQWEEWNVTEHVEFQNKK